jgi:hypothetical protein
MCGTTGQSATQTQQLTLDAAGNGEHHDDEQQPVDRRR